MQLLQPNTTDDNDLNIRSELTKAEWTDLHRDIIRCKHKAQHWLKQSREYAVTRWGLEFAADTEAQLELDLGLALEAPKPELNPNDKTRAILTIEGISQKFILWQRKMREDIEQWDKDRLSRALELLEPMEQQAKRVRELLSSQK